MNSASNMVETQSGQVPRSRLNAGLQVLIRTIAPLLLALAAAGGIIWAMGVNPVQFYGDIIALGLGGTGWQKSLTLMAPLLLIALHSSTRVPRTKTAS